MKYTWIHCLCGKDVHMLDMPRHYQTKHEWPNEHERTTKTETETSNEAGGGAEATA